MYENRGKKLQLSNWNQKKKHLLNIGHAQMVNIFLQAAGQFSAENLER